MKILDSKKNIIRIEKKALASGGEGAVHLFKDKTLQGYCVKIYNKKFRTKERERKISYMSLHPPNKLMDANWLLCWPTDLVYDYHSGEFLGFVMHLAFKHSELLYELCNPTLRKKMTSSWRKKYDRKEITGIMSRLKLCVNISSGINIVHQTNKYVFIDFKPQNVLVTHTGRISLIDLDSLQINGKFKAQVATPEYIPPEGIKLSPSKNFIEKSWDNFSIAVVFYQILFGLHPYAVTPKPSYSKETTLDSHIKNKLFPFGENAKFVEKKSVLHDKFKILPLKFQQLFLRSFDLGHATPSIRPSASEWGQAIFLELKKKDNFKEYNSKHNTQKKPSSINRPQKLIQPRKSINSKLTIKKKNSIPVKADKYYFVSILTQLVGAGLFYLDSNSIRKWLYVTSFSLGVFILFMNYENVAFFKSDEGFLIFIACSFLVYVVGIIDVIISTSKYKSNN